MKYPARTSSAGLWTKCPGSVQMSLKHALPVEESDVRKEGTAAHEVIDLLASGHEVKDGQLASNGCAIDEAMIEGAQLFLETVGEGATHETKIDCSVLLEGLNAIPDAVRIDGTTLRIWDYKYGHSFVDAFQNAQMLVEASAFMDKGLDKVEFTIVQPRCYHAEPVRSWSIDWAEYVADWLPVLKDAAQETQKDDAELQTGPHCAMCPARHACKLLQKVAGNAIDAAHNGPNGQSLSGDSLGVELRILHDAVARIEARIKGLEEHAKHELENGKPVYGYELKQSYGHTDWTIEKDKVIALGDVLGMDLRKPAAPISPSQAKKLGFDAKTLEGITQRPFRGHTLKPINMDKMKGVFK